MTTFMAPNLTDNYPLRALVDDSAAFAWSGALARQIPPTSGRTHPGRNNRLEPAASPIALPTPFNVGKAC